MEEDAMSEACCSWCFKSASEVQVLIEGRGCYICDECAELCTEIAREKKEGGSASRGRIPEGMPVSVQEALRVLGGLVEEKDPNCAGPPPLRG